MLDPAARRQLRKSLDTPVGKDAFACFREKECPESTKCPMWYSMELDDPVEGRERFEGCGFKLLPTYFHLTMGFSLGAMQTSEAFGQRVEQAIVQGVQEMKQVEAQRELKVLNAGRGE